MLQLSDVWFDPLRSVSATFTQGLHVVFGRPEDGLARLAELCAGHQPPQRGKVRLLSKDPYRTASIRAQMGSVLAVEPKLPAQQLSTIIGHRLPPAAASSATDLLSACGLLGRAAPSLSADERRSVAFLLATSVQRELLVVYEPFTGLPGIHSHAVTERLRAQVAGGAILLTLTSNLAHTSELGGASWLLDRGQLSTLDENSARQLAEQSVALLVTCSAAAQLASAMLADATLGVSFDPLRPEQLVVTSAQPDLASLRVLEIATRSGFHVDGLSRYQPTLDQLRAAAAGRAQAAFQRAAHAPASTRQGTLTRAEGDRR